MKMVGLFLLLLAPIIFLLLPSVPYYWLIILQPIFQILSSFFHNQAFTSNSTKCASRVYFHKTFTYNLPVIFIVQLNHIICGFEINSYPFLSFNI